MLFKKVSNFLQKNKWRALAEKAKKTKRLAGFFHENYIYNVDGKPCLFRFVIPTAHNMNPMAMEEIDVLERIQGSGLSCPSLIYADHAEDFYVEEVIEGDTVENLYPPGTKMPEEVFDQIIEFYKKIITVKPSQFYNIMSPEWPRTGTPHDFFITLSDQNHAIYKRSYMQNPQAFGFLGFDNNPYKALREQSKKLGRRPLCFLHGDLHRGNIMIDDKKHMTAIDWELSMVGDIMYCFSRNIHIGRYYESETKRFCEKFKEQMPREYTVNFDDDFQFYLTYEALRSVITDTIRFPEVFKEERFSAKKEAELCMYYSDNLNKIAPLIGCRTTTPDEALRWFQEWG